MERAVLRVVVNLKMLVLLGAIVVTGHAQPAQIILLRHAEKPLDDSIPHLSLRGNERAAALAVYLSSNPVCTNFGSPVAVFAANPTADSPSQRTTETLTPYSERNGIPIQTPYSADQFAELAAGILNNTNYAGKSVIICWPHDQLPALAHMLNVPRPPSWNKAQFDRLWVIRYNTGRARLLNLPQRLLFGDSPH